jgi:hypothetical protein
MSVHAEDLSAAATIPKPRFGALRRWWLEINLPACDSDLTVAQWDQLAERYVAAGGTLERFEALIEVNVREL